MPVFSRLELKNFKTYRDEVLFEWKQVSAVIGLNGAGKSTISHAVEFVFCFPKYNFTKKALEYFRTHICNLEYSRSDDCPSTVVKATLCHEGKEVTFERSIDYYENINRYLINEEEVTLKDYRSRLLELNINSFANNFLVKQNSIECIAILNAKERCEYFEQACNSIAYKSEYNRLKGETNRALKTVDESKAQLKTLYTKLKNLGKLSKEFEKYEKLQRELETTNFEYYFATFFTIDKDLDLTREHKKELAMNIRVAEKLKTSYKAKIEELQSSLEDEEGQARLEKLQQRLRNTTLKLSQVKEILLVHEKKIKKLKVNLETIKKHDAAREKTIEDLKQQLAEVQKQIDEVERLESLSSSIQLDEEQYEEFLKLKAECVMFTVKEGELKESIQRDRNIINDKLEFYQRQEKLFLDQIKIKSANLEKLKSDIDQTSKHRDSTESYIQKSSREILDLDLDIQNSNLQVESLNKEISDLKTKLGDSKISNTWSRQAQIKKGIVKELQSHFPGVYERLKNLVEITDRQFDVAITKILKGKMEYILVDNADTARKCINYTKQQYIREKFNVIETYMPLNKIKVIDPQYVLAKIKDDPTVRLATWVVSVSREMEGCEFQKIQTVLESALENTVICEDAQTAMKYSQTKQINCVTLEGVLFRKDGLISGGLASLLKKARVWSENEIENLKNQKQLKIDDMKKLVSEIRKKKEKKNVLEIKLSGLQSRLKGHLEPSLKEKKELLKKEKDKLTELQKELVNMKDSSDMEELKLELKKIDDKLMEVNKKIEAIEKEYFAPFCQKLNIDNIQHYEKGNFKKYQQRWEHKRKLLDHYCKIENQLKLETNPVEEYDPKKLTNDLQQYEKAYLETEQSQEKLNAKIAKITNSIESLKQELAGDEKRKELKIKERELNAVDSDLRKWNSLISGDDAKIIRLKAKKHGILANCLEQRVKIPLQDSSIENVLLHTKPVINTESEESNTTESENDSQVKEEHVAIDYSKLPKSIKKLQDSELKSYIKTLQEKQTKINEQIESINVIPRAKEDLQLLKKEVEETENQHKQLLNDLAEIKGKFDAVKNQRTETFKTFFDAVANNIDGIFKNLYRDEGAQALLLMKSEDEPYLDGIDYQCIIPKKKFGLLKEFSGGEKTMCALTLLLAIYNAKPTSFLIFDEIDAALDNKNVARIINYFTNLKLTTQIINISHNHKLSVIADALIGINFSVEKNTSYAVHIDLVNYQKNTDPDKCLAAMAEERLAALQ